jgi:transposase
MNRCLLDMLNDVTARCGISLRRAAHILDISRSSHHRWQRRVAQNAPIVRQPGPTKFVAADIEAISRDVAALDHGTHRTFGTAALHQRYADTISRRDLQALVHNERLRQVALRREGYDELTWKGAGIVWAMDDTRYEEWDVMHKLLWIHHVRDIGAHYSLQPMSGSSLPRSDEVAANLYMLFRSAGAPLFVKRDNGGNLNTPDVNEVLAEFCVIPFNSPPYTPTYNGAIERAQETLKIELTRQLASAKQWNVTTAQPYVRAAAHQINHIPLSTLNNTWACHYRATSMLRFTKQERKTTYDWILNACRSILEDQEKGMSVQTAQRLAVMAWLVKNKLVTINRH